MRADRLLAILMVLQARGKVTAQTLADALDISRRTILRDVQALTLAGVPICSEGGHGGGIALDETYRATLTRLHAPEVQALFATQNQTGLRDVALNDAADQLLLKLFAALPASPTVTVDHIRQRLMVDSAWWWHDTERSPYWADIQRAVYEDWMIEAAYEVQDGVRLVRILEPYSLIHKAGVWYVVGRREGDFKTYDASRFQAVEVLDQRFTRDPSFDLPTYWQAHLADVIAPFSADVCTLRLYADRMPLVQWLTPGRWQILEEHDEAKKVTIRLMVDSEPLIKLLILGLGEDCEVLDPPDLAEFIIEDTERLLRYMKKGFNSRGKASPSRRRSARRRP